MNSGRVVKDGWSHDNTVTGIEFHPAEFILATSSTDKTVRIWDLEVFQLLDTLGPEATAVKAIAYHKDGKQLLTATADALHVWGFDPAMHHDRVPMDWRQLADMHLSYKDDQPRVIGCCTNQAAVGVFLVDLRKVMPFCATSLPVERPASIGAGDSRQKQQQQSSHMQPPPQRSGIGSCGRPREQALPNSYRGASTDAAPINGAGSAYGHPGISPVSHISTASTSEPAAGPLSRQLNKQRTPPGLPTGSSCSAGGLELPLGVAAKVMQCASAAGESPLMQHLQPGQLSRADNQHPPGRRKTGEFFPEFEIRVPDGPPPQLPTPEERMASRRNSSRSLGVDRFSSASSSRRVSGQDPDAAATALRGMSISEQQQPGLFGSQQQGDGVGSRGGSATSSIGPSPRDRSPAPVVAVAVPPPARSTYSGSAGGFSSYGGSSAADSSYGGAAGSVGGSAASAVDPVAAAMAQRPLLRSELAKMVSGLQIAKGFIARGNLEGAYKSVVSHGDAAVACMVVEAIQGRQDAFELSSVEPLVKLLELVLGSGIEQQQIVGLSALSLVLRGPGQVVRDVCNGPAPTGVDLSYEQRRTKCLLVKMALEGLGMKVGFMARGSGPTATRAQLVAEELKRIVS